MSEVFSPCRLRERLEVLPSEEEEISLPRSERVIGRIDRLVLAVGALRVECAALVVGECHFGYGPRWVTSGKAWSIGNTTQFKQN